MVRHDIMMDTPKIINRWRPPWRRRSQSSMWCSRAGHASICTLEDGDVCAASSIASS